MYGTYCLGTPEETWATVEKTWRFANELDIESGFTVMTPFPGTPMYFRALREGLLPRRMQFSRWNSYSSTVRTYALTTTDLDMARWWARMETILPYRKRRKGGWAPVARRVIRSARAALRFPQRLPRVRRGPQESSCAGRRLRVKSIGRLRARAIVAKEVGV